MAQLRFLMLLLFLPGPSPVQAKTLNLVVNPVSDYLAISSSCSDDTSGILKYQPADSQDVLITAEGNVGMKVALPCH